MDILNLLERIEDIIEDASKFPLSSKLMVDKAILFCASILNIVYGDFPCDIIIFLVLGFVHNNDIITITDLFAIMAHDIEADWGLLDDKFSGTYFLAFDTCTHFTHAAKEIMALFAIIANIFEHSC